MKVGDYFRRRGQRYRFDGITEYWTRDGRTVDLALLTTRCADCGQVFEFKAPYRKVKSGAALNRRCDEHRNPGVPVRSPAKDAKPSKGLLAAKRRLETERRRAQAAKLEASKQRRLAESAIKEAEAHRRIAQAAVQEAEAQRQRAQAAKAEATKQRRIARAAETEAAKQARRTLRAEQRRRKLAVKQKAEAVRRRALKFLAERRAERRQISQRIRLRREATAPQVPQFAWLR